MPQRPAMLSPGDTVSLIAPASPPRSPDFIDKGVAIIERLGFRVKLGLHVRNRNGFLAGDDQERVEDIHRAFADPEVKAIFCVRGGHGTTRILSKIDYRIIRLHPKIFLGFSDITALHCAFLRRANLVTFHGPHLASQFVISEPPAFVLENLRATLMRNHPVGSLCAAYPDRHAKVNVLSPGRASGPLMGGNLSLLCSLIGTPYEPLWQGRILFLEEVGEPPYRIDRSLTYLLNAGRLQRVAGIAIGQCLDCEDRTARHEGEFRQNLLDVLRERLTSLGVPVLAGFPFGHDNANCVLPLGVTATIDSGTSDLMIDGSAVRR